MLMLVIVVLKNVRVLYITRLYIIYYTIQKQQQHSIQLDTCTSLLNKQGVSLK